MSRLALWLLGAPRVEEEGRPLRVDTRKAVALLAYLATTGTPHRRDALAALLWPDYDQRRARAALRRTLSALRGALEGDWLIAERDMVGVREGLWCDVLEFERALSEAEDADDRPALLERAVELYRGDFLAGFGLRDSPTFDDWQMLEAERLRLRLLGALGELVEEYAVSGSPRGALQHALRWVAVDPLQEAAHRWLMRLHAQLGDRSAALRQYRECGRLLEEELGVAPLDETTRLFEELREGHGVAVEPQPSLVEAPSGPIELPMVGREEPWAALIEAHQRAAAGGWFVVLEGEPGVGKTRLLEEFIAWARDRGTNVVAGRCFEGESDLAYGLVTALVASVSGSDLPDEARAEGARLVPELRVGRPELPPPSALEGPGARLRFLQGLASLLASAVGPGGVLAVDDLHWADEASLEVLSFLVRRLEQHRVLVLATWRSGVAAALQRMLSETRRRGTGVQVAVQRLSPAGVARLAGAAGSPDLADLLYEETEGLPFFVVEYLRAGQRAEGELPGGARELLGSRLAPLSDLARQLLAAASVIGRQFDPALLRAVSGRSEDEVASGLEELLARGLLREPDDTAGAGYQFDHHLLQTFVYRQTTLARRRLLHRRAARALEGPAGDARASQVAHHLREAGLDALAAEAHVRAGREARGLSAPREALDHFRAALALGHPEGAELHLEVGELLLLLGEYREARLALEVAAALAGEGLLPHVEGRLADLAGRRGAWNEAREHLEVALGGEPQPRHRARLLADLSLVEHRLGNDEVALGLAGEALGLADEAGDRRALAQAHNLAGILAKSRGQGEEGLRHLQRSLSLSEELGDAGAQAAALNNLALLAAQDEDLEAAARLLGEALESARRDGDIQRQAAVCNNLADVSQAAGDRAAAMRHLKQAVVLFAEIESEPGRLEPEIWKLVEW